MLVKAGVDLSRLNRKPRRLLTTIGEFFMNRGKELVITSTYEGTHTAGSLHYSNDAFDFRLSLSLDDSDKLKNLLIKHHGKSAQLIRESTHFHCEWDED